MAKKKGRKAKIGVSVRISPVIDAPAAAVLDRLCKEKQWDLNRVLEYLVLIYQDVQETLKISDDSMFNVNTLALRIKETEEIMRLRQ